MNIIDVTPENIGTEHICCAITERKDETCVKDKKRWMLARMTDDGLTFKKLDVRGKVFIEYWPAEKAWTPIDAPGYIHINCLWVSGKFKQQGHASALLAACIEDARAKGALGLTIISADKKRPFLADPDFLVHKGFIKADDAAPYFTLYYLPFAEGAPTPRFREHAKHGTTDNRGMVLYYADQCPFSNTYAKRLEAIARHRGVPFTLIRLQSSDEAQASPTPWPTYSFFDHGEFVTNEIQTEASFLKYLETR